MCLSLSALRFENGHGVGRRLTMMTLAMMETCGSISPHCIRGVHGRSDDVDEGKKRAEFILLYRGFIEEKRYGPHHADQVKIVYIHNGRSSIPITGDFLCRQHMNCGSTMLHLEEAGRIDVRRSRMYWNGKTRQIFPYLPRAFI